MMNRLVKAYQQNIRTADLSRTYADYIYKGEQQFLEEVAKGIKKIAGKHASRVEVVRKGGRIPFLVYEGENRSDIPMEMVISLAASSPSDVKLMYWGETSDRGRFDEKPSFKWGTLKPADAVEEFKNIFG